jgi:hypothetical protein
MSEQERPRPGQWIRKGSRPADLFISHATRRLGQPWEDRQELEKDLAAATLPCLVCGVEKEEGKTRYFSLRGQVVWCEEHLSTRKERARRE